MKQSLRIGITIGDPAGIGPEVSVKALDIVEPGVIPVLLGRREVVALYFPRRINEFIIIDDSTLANIREGGKYLYDIPGGYPLPQPGKGTRETGRESLDYLDRALMLWRKGAIDALATAPVNKGLIEKSGTPFTGHTEYLAERIDERDPFMMMFSEKYRVILATTHMPLAAVPAALSPGRLDRIIDMAWSSMMSIDGGEVRIAMAGLDPHCGDDGCLGSFDRDVTAPAVARARARGINIEGPLSADTVFIPRFWERYNIVIAHYHDQGLIPFKMLAFDRGVNVTLGLSLTRTSADHGTAYDLAGRDRAEFSSMAEAVNLAARLEPGRRNRAAR